MIPRLKPKQFLFLLVVVIGMLNDVSVGFCSSTSYLYDSLNRLTKATYANGSTISYTYDAAGNRLTYSGIATNDTNAPTIMTPPQSQTAVSGNTISFTVAATGSGPLTYQWQLSTNGGGTWINLSNDATYAGVQTTTLTLNGPTVAMNGYQFRAVVSNGASSSTPSPAATLTVRAGGQFSQQGPKLVGTGAVGIAAQGNSASLSADGNTAIVGGPFDNGNTGAAWVWTRSAGVWTQQGNKLVGSGAIGLVYQGISVSLSADGNTAIVGGPVDNSKAGAAWVWTRSGGVWTQQGPKLVGSSAVGGANQGHSVSLSADGNTAIVGGRLDNSDAGAAWVWTRSGGVWTQQGTKLVGSGAVGNARQGGSVSLSADGNTALVGGWGDNSSAGAAWVWTRSGGVWTQQGTKLVGSGAVGVVFQGDSVSLSGDGNTALVGGPNDNSNAGAAWVWTRSAGVWTQQGTKLVGSGAVGPATQGISVSLSADGNTAIIGGYGDDSNAGAAWVWTRSGGVWTQQGTKLAGLGAVGVVFQGTSVSLSADGTTAIVGGVNDNSYAGAAWVFAAPAPAFSGTVVAWGYNGMGQTTVPAGLSGVTAIAAGWKHTVALKSDGTVVAWGDNSWGQTTVPAGLSEVRTIAAGDGHTVALKSDGTVVAWGDNGPGQTTVPAGLSGVTAIAAGDRHTVVLKSDGTVVAWGWNGYGQTTVPAGLSGVTAIAANGHHTVALKSDGTVVAWGWNDYGQTTVPAGLSGVTAIAAGDSHTVALKSDGTVVAWGSNFYGETSVPAGWSGVMAIAAGGYYTVALKIDGTVVAWGENDYGQTTVPAGLIGVTAIAAGGLHTVALIGTGVIGPTVTARSTGNNLTLIWPDSAPGYRVESALSLSPPISWSTVVGTLQTNGGFISMVVPTSGPQMFFRLVKGNTSAAPTNMALIPAGPFIMGDSFYYGDSDALPLHTNQISAFYMDKFEVTKALWDEVYNWAVTHGYSFDYGAQGKANNHPAQTMTWYDAVKWCNARSEKENRTPAYYTSAAQITPYRTGQTDVQDSWVKWSSGYRLPTEAEWEKAARGGASGRRFPWGNTISWSQANYYSYWSGGVPDDPYDVNPTPGYPPTFSDGDSPYTSPVDYFTPNGYGLYDMAGNVWQWCWDWYSRSYYGSSPASDPRGPATGPGRVLRGGSWGNGGATGCRSAIRAAQYPAARDGTIGYRAVLAPGQ